MALAVEQHHADTGTIGKLAHDPRPFHSCAAGAVGRDRPLYQGRRAPHMRSRAHGLSLAGRTLSTLCRLRRRRRERSEEHTSELPSLMRISYAVSCLKKKKKYYYKTIPNIP